LVATLECTVVTWIFGFSLVVCTADSIEAAIEALEGLLQVCDLMHLSTDKDKTLLAGGKPF